MNPQNPLQQYFRRPSIHFRLPSNYTYNPGVVEVPATGELPVYPMTAIDEVTTRTPDALFNGSAVVDVIKSCVPSIKNPWEITSVDLDPILVAIRIATNGDKMEIDTECPKCNEPARYGVSLTDMLNKFRAGDYSKTLKVGQLEFKFRPLTYRQINTQAIDQFSIQKTLINLDSMEEGDAKTKMVNDMFMRINDLTLKAVASTIEHITTPESRVSENNFIVEFLQNCEAKVYEEIRDYSISLRQTSQTPPLNITCPSCQHKYEQPFTVNVSDFFG